MASETSAMAVIRASRPSFRNPHDKIAFALHASFLAAGYVLTATGIRAFSEEASSPSSSGQEEVGIDGWNELDDCYGFVYTKTGKDCKKKVIAKCLVIDEKLAIDVILCSAEQGPLHLEINVKDYDSGEGTGSTNYGDLYKNFADLIGKLNSCILAKLENRKASPTSSRSNVLKPDEGTEHGRVPQLTPFHDESGIVYPPVIPTGFGDVFPGPGAGFYPTRGDMRGGGGMLVGPNDPRWFGIGGEQPGFMPGIPGVPSGARFDPYGPPDVPGFEPGRFVRNPPRRPGRDTHPDLEHFRNPNDYI